MAFGTLAMATAVTYFNIKTLRQNQQQMAIARRQLDTLRRERERPQVVELLKFAIVPLLRQMVEELGALEKRKYLWIHRSGTARSMLMLREVANWEGKEVMEDLRRRFPRVKELMDDHDGLITPLNEKLKALDRVIYTPEFVEKCKKAIKTYNASSEKPIRKRAIPDASQHFVAYVIENLRELPEANPYHDFWKKHASQFLEIREEEEVKKRINDVEKSTTKLAKISLSLTEKVVELRDKLKEEYWITAKEIEGQ